VRDVRGFANIANDRGPGPRRRRWEPTIKQLSEAESVVENGTAEVDGQQVSQFTVTFAPGIYPRSELPFGELFEKACPEPVQIDLALAPSGLPVRVDLSANYLRSNEAVTTTTITEILATNFRFPKLKPPPAKRTISAAALQGLSHAGPHSLDVLLERDDPILHRPDLGLRIAEQPMNLSASTLAVVVSVAARCGLGRWA
jgi:hypothetical protein